MPIKIGVPTEIREHEQRVALVPDIVKRLVKLETEVEIQAGAGELAGYGDEDFDAANIVQDGASVLQNADITLMVNPIELPQIESLKPGSVLIGYLNPYGDLERFTKLAQRNISAFSMEMIPRISRAQAMDALSSQASC
jgi:NAD(P) transhydrogenase subunit alpha